MVRKRNIKLHVTFAGQVYTIETYAHEYRNLMMLVYDKVYVEGFGECKGIGRCGTCHVKMPSDNQEVLLERQGNESATLGKMETTTENSRLACQIMVDERLNGLTIELMTDGDMEAY